MKEKTKMRIIAGVWIVTVTLASIAYLFRTIEKFKIILAEDPINWLLVPIAVLASLFVYVLALFPGVWLLYEAHWGKEK